MTDPVGAVLALLAGERATAMYDEVVNEREHALQTAQLAEQAGSSEATVAAALLHDVGRLLTVDDPTFVAADRAHDRVGEHHLRPIFGPEVSAPVGLHVAAKRYLCATEADYLARLSPVSVRSLERQGGPMSSAEAAAFRAGEGWEAAVQLRRWDDEAKHEGRATRLVTDYRPLLDRLALGALPA